FYSLHHASFTLASIISTTGFSTVDFDVWPQFGRTLLVIVMCVGACAGSTGGGFKVSRIILLFKEARNELHLLVHPKAVRVVKLNGKSVDSGTLRSVNHYLILYVAVFALSVLLISFDGFDFTTNFSAVAATLNNIGPGLSVIGPVRNFSQFSIFSKIILTFDMIAGRLELLPMLLLFSRKNWSKHF
ncbi:MAG: TrkH family potassium uptake protein, partial [Lachnospiraceae bacterium]|nr:TrkH family potassium uptake protein [Lachnospiraceae bacterium]